MSFLFTDIEGSTRRWEADAAAMRIALTAHDETLRNAVEHHGGWLFKHTGDGVMVFVGGFNIESACAVASFEESDEYDVLDRLDSLVRKSLLVAERSDGRTRFSMLETIRQFAEEQLVADQAEHEVRAAHARYFAKSEAAMLALWDSPRQRTAYDWFNVELANLRNAFRWAAGASDLDAAVAIATVGAFLGYGIDNYEPVGWAEEIVDPARAVRHPRLAVLYTLASQCWLPGRMEAAVGYSDEGCRFIGEGDEVPFGAEGMLSTSYFNSGKPDRAIELCRKILERGRDTHGLTRSLLVFSLVVAGFEDDAMATADGLIEIAEASGNPFTLTFALLVYGMAFRRADPHGSRDALRRGLVMAHDSANRSNESQLAICLASVEAKSDDPKSAFEYVALAIRNLQDSGNTTTVSSPLAVLSALLDRLGDHEPAATIAGFALNPFTAAAVPELIAAIANLREVLGEQRYETLAAVGEQMSNAEMAAYACERIDRARAEEPSPTQH